MKVASEMHCLELGLRTLCVYHITTFAGQPKYTYIHTCNVTHHSQEYIEYIHTHREYTCKQCNIVQHTHSQSVPHLCKIHICLCNIQSATLCNIHTFTHTTKWQHATWHNTRKYT